MFTFPSSVILSEDITTDGSTRSLMADTQKNLMFVQSNNMDYIISEKSQIEKLRIGSIRKCRTKGREYLSARLLSETGGRPILLTKPFRCTGIYHQDANRAPNSLAPVNAVIRITADSNPILVEIMEALQRLVRLNIGKLAEEYQKGNGINTFCEKLMSGDDDEYIKSVFKSKDDRVMFIRCQPDMKVFVLHQQTGLMPAMNLQNMQELPRMGLYMVRIDPSLVYIGQHGSDTTSICSISYRVEQVVYSPIEMATSPMELAMDITDMKTQLMICDPQAPVNLMEELPAIATKKSKPSKPRSKVKEDHNPIEGVM